MYAYGECVPLLLAGMLVGCFGGLACCRKGNGRNILLTSAAIAILSTALVAPELPRFFRAISSQASAVVGEAVDWTSSEFFLYAVGGQTGPWEGETRWLAGSVDSTCAMLTALGGAILARAWLRTGPKLPALQWLSVAGFAAFCAGLYFKFRLFTPSPFPIGTGQTWSQFKLAGWSTLPITGLLTLAGGSAIGRTTAGRVSAWILAALLFTAVALGLRQSREMAPVRTRNVIDDIGTREAPLAAVAQFCSTLKATVDHGTPVRLALPPEMNKLQQFLAYLLMDRPILADWRGDGYIAPNLPGLPSAEQLEAANWLVTRGTGLGSNPLVRAGLLRLDRTPAIWFEPSMSTGGYDVERSVAEWGQWVESAVEYEFEIHRRNEAPPSARVVFTAQFVSRSPNQRITAIVFGADGSKLEERSWEMEPTAIKHSWLGPTIAELGRHWRIRFSSNEPARILGPIDPRRASFMIRNLAVEPAEPASPPAPAAGGAHSEG